MRGSKGKKLTIPSCNEDHQDGNYQEEFSDLKAVADYAHLSFSEILEIDVFNFYALLRDAVIFNAKQTEEGKEWLDECWVQQQTEPDRAALRRRFGDKKSKVEGEKNVERN